MISQIELVAAVAEELERQGIESLVPRQMNAIIAGHNRAERKTMTKQNDVNEAPVHGIVPRPVLYWVLVGHWEGTPFPIMRGEDPPPFSVWSVTDQKHWEELRSEKYYTRRSKSRPVAKVDREFQKQTGKDVWEE